MKLKQSQLPAYRAEQLAKQQGLDPITGLKIVNPVCDHDHAQGNMRMVLDRETNTAEGKFWRTYVRYVRYRGVSVEDFLKGLLWYYSQDFSGHPKHPLYLDKEEKRELRNKRARKKRNQKKAKT